MGTQYHPNGQMKLGEHYICDLSNCDQSLLFDSERARRLFTEAVRTSGLSIVDEGYFEFSPHGFTCFLLLEESHASLHAWPEYGYCAVDLFTCSLELNLTPFFNTLTDLFGTGHSDIRKVERLAVTEKVWQP